MILATPLRSLVARRALRWLPAFDALLGLALFAMLWPSNTPLWFAAPCFALALLLHRALGGIGVASFHPALPAFALAFVSGLVESTSASPLPWIALALIATDRLYLPTTSRGKALQLSVFALAALALHLIGAQAASFVLALLALQFITPWLDRLTLPALNRTPPHA